MITADERPVGAGGRPVDEFTGRSFGTYDDRSCIDPAVDRSTETADLPVGRRGHLTRLEPCSVTLTLLRERLVACIRVEEEEALAVLVL